MSPNPRREKGLSHRANGEEFSRGTFRTIGSLERERHTSDEKHSDTTYQNSFLLHSNGRLQIQKMYLFIHSLHTILLITNKII